MKKILLFIIVFLFTSVTACALPVEVQEIIENKIANEIVEGNLIENNTIEFYLEENKIKYKIC